MSDSHWWADEFPVRDELTYLNHAGVCPIPARTASAVAEMADDCRDRGAWNFERWRGVAERCRRRLANLMGAEPQELAIVKNTTSGLLLVAESILWREGDNVVVADIEFPANVYPWLNLQRRGVQTRFVSARGRFPTVDDYAAACDQSTRAIAVSWVQFATGQRADLAGLADIAHRSGGYLVVDAIQGLGALQIDVHDLGIDFLAADGHKWLLSVEGCGVLYVSSRVIGDLEPFWRGWASVPEPYCFLEYSQPARDDARRFEEGSATMLGIVALDCSVGLLLEVGLEVERRVLMLTERLIDGLQRLGCEMASPLAPQQRSGIVCARAPGISPDDVVEHLADARIYAASRAGAVRLSPHFYNTEDEIDRTLQVIAEII
ncbi:MAG: aminotransferase class V-fold PLP-dependent enzyme [Armatimonadota bacterium]|nr:aminotransferase class V-fold PLP-dependent enzyme [Armatimonadota bacterium]